MSDFTYDRQVAEEQAARRLASRPTGPKVTDLTEEQFTRAVTKGVFAGTMRVVGILALFLLALVLIGIAIR